MPSTDFRFPTTDAAAFTAEDKLRLSNLDGSSASAVVRKINSISGNDITLDGDFGGALAAGKVLVFAEWDDDLRAAQKTEHTFFADQTAQTIDADATARPYRYAEP